MSGHPFNDKTIFLPGGHDLEMQEIRNILDERELKYFDFNLQRRTTLNNFLPVFKSGHTSGKIERIEDCAKLIPYIAFNHRNNACSLNYFKHHL